MNLDDVKVPSVGDSVTIGDFDRFRHSETQQRLALGPATLDPKKPDAHLGATESDYDYLE